MRQLDRESIYNNSNNFKSTLFESWTDWTYEKGGHRKAEIRFGFPEWLTAEITGSHIQELTRFQHEIFAGLRRSSQTSRVNPGSSAPRKCMKSSRSSCISRFIIRTAILPGTILARGNSLRSGRQISIEILQISKEFPPMKWHLRNLLISKLLISKLRARQSFPFVWREFTDEKQEIGREAKRSPFNYTSAN